MAGGHNISDISGLTFGQLRVLSRAGVYKNGSVQWRCMCSCGAECIVLGQKLRNGRVVSCGCAKAQRLRNLNRTHGDSDTRLFNIWRGMKNRCSNPNFIGWRYYGGKGIRVCDAWVDDFAAFREWSLANGYSDSLTIDRVKGDQDYGPGNCRWATRSEQNKNRARPSL